MQHRPLGKSGVSISTVTFGCWELGGGPWEFTSDENNIRTLHAALNEGITTFDTAEGYGSGHSEEIVGQALEGRRQDCIISTKVSRANLAPDNVRKSAEQSLRRLRTDYIDIYYIHWPSYDIPVAETLGEFNKLKEEGKIRAIGVSNFSIDQLKEASQYAQIDVIQPEYSLLHRGIEKEIIPYCLEQQIGIMSYSSIAKGILTGAFHFGGKKLETDDFRATRRLFLPEHLEAETQLINLMQHISERKGISMSQLAISWLLHRPAMTSAIVGTQSISHLKDNAEAANVQLEEDDLQQLMEVSDAVLAMIDTE
ncbi:aldo/keto reductase [Paenibacillus allorhizosphaerae]|uniref:Aldo-keto reductase YhdN n=1 Tax=Paenibacillus allorhizosphaerae TaxID=2849866 RepID=A0ABM8VHY0_9BACL|nr:aldo/keto reductase [Paenibacillus allorhizosphaerae]CAG7643266.1 Aldo-keto reductase YhdN [Paenibacillus allorhizosphaerae]